MTGTLFFVPSATFLDVLGEDAAAMPRLAARSTAEPASSKLATSDGSLGIGSLKGENGHE